MGRGESSAWAVGVEGGLCSEVRGMLGYSKGSCLGVLVGQAQGQAGLVLLLSQGVLRGMDQAAPLPDPSFPCWDQNQT